MKRSGKLYFLAGLAAGALLFAAAGSFYDYASRFIHFPFLGEMPLNSKIEAIYNVLDMHFVDDYDKDDLRSGMYSGLISRLGDPYSSYMDPREAADFLQMTDGTYAGIGIVVTVDRNDNRIVVLTPYEGTPGALAGILPGDKLIEVDGAPVTGDMLDEAVSMMKGEPGTSVSVTVYRESNGEVFELTIIRAVINIPTVSHTVLDDGVGYIKISGFDRVTTGQFRQSLYDLRTQRIKGLVIDLLDNPGGLLDVVVDITDMPVVGHYIVYTEDKHGEREYFYSSGEHLEIPLTVLVNERSASASEILAGAVKDTGAGTLVGTTTFGKGLVQSFFYLPDRSAVKTTVAKYYTPSGVCIDHEGITPDYEIELPEEYRQSVYVPPESDTQLQKAIEIVLREAAYSK